MPRAIDVPHLPAYAFGHRSITWWGVASLMAIEGMMFALLIMSYLYLKGRSPDWPPGFLLQVRASNRVLSDLRDCNQVSVCSAAR